MASYGRQAKVGFIVGMLGRGAMDLATIPTTIVLARLLTPHDFGVAAAAGFFVTVAQRLTNLGFNVGIVRLGVVTPAHLSMVFLINMFLGGSAWLLLTLLSPALAAFFRSPESGVVIPVVASTFVIGALGTVPNALLHRDLKFTQLLTIQSLASWVAAIATMLLAWKGMQYWSLVYGNLLGAGISTGGMFIVSGWKPTIYFSSAALRELWSIAFGVHVKRTLDSAAANLDNLVVGRALGLSELGIYDKAFTTMNRAVTWVSALGPSVSLSVLAKLQDDPERFRSASRKVLLGTSLLGYPLFGTLAGVAYPLFVILFGDQWLGAVLPFQVLCVAGSLKLLAMYVNSAMEAKGRVWGAAALQAVYTALIVAGVTAATPWGLTGAAVAVLVATFIMAMTMCDLLRRVSVLTWSDILAPQIPGVMCGVSVAALLGALSAVTPVDLMKASSVWQALVLRGGAALAFYVAFLLLVPMGSVRQFVDEVAVDLAPAVSRRLPKWIRIGKTSPQTVERS